MSLYSQPSTVDLETVQTLVKLGSSFWLFLRAPVGEDWVSEKSSKILRSFLKNNTSILVVEVVIDLIEANKLTIAYLPQLRLYRQGTEVQRHRGIADYNTLTSLFQLTLK